MATQLADVAENPRAVIGANNPPLTPYEATKLHIEDLFETAQGFLDGEPILTQAQADEVDKIKAAALEAEKAGEELRKAEAKPFDDGKKEVQARWNPLVNEKTGKCRLIISTCSQALTPYLKAKQAELDAIAAEKQKLADELVEQARIQHQQAAGDLAARAEAEEVLQTASLAQAQAHRAGNARAQAKGGARATSLRDVWTPALVNAKEALQHYMVAQPDLLKAWLQEQAEKDIRSGIRAIPGFRIDHDQRAA